MAKIVITTFGSMGDHNPFLALGLGLRERGHQIIFAVEQLYQDFFSEQGFETHALYGDVEKFSREHSREIFTKNNEAQAIQVIIKKYQVPVMTPRTHELKELCQGADLLISSAVQLATANIEDLLGIPVASVALTPGAIPTQYISQRLLPRRTAPGLVRLQNRIFWRLAKTYIRATIDPTVNKERAVLGLPPRRDWMFDGNLSKKLTAVAVSEAFVPRPPDWPATTKMTGFMFWDKPHNWQEPEALTAFLNDSKPVVALSSGSMAELTRNEFKNFFQTSLAAIHQAGAKALVMGAAPEVLPDPLPADTLALSFAPFSEIYPRCTAVIHHGGIGTTAQGLRAGKPTLIVPWGFDQFYSGVQIFNSGVGLTCKRNKYNLKKASQLVSELLTNPAYAQKAGAMAQRIQQEDGVANLCHEIEILLQKSFSQV